ncbi:DUF6527 family protein [Caulobacter sp.]|uniref:DUF6527 family protein n=1 Tax=Caulobacter sp. TaxID=78 RepID=UPI003BAE4EE7
MLCPCGCREILHLRFLQRRRPRWDLSVNGQGRASLHPSVWRRTGCQSHFILRDGQILWC